MTIVEKLLEEICAERIDEEKYSLKQLPDGKWAFYVHLGRPGKARTKLWARKIQKVNTEQKSGYAFEGPFFKTIEGRAEIILAPGEMAIAIIQTGSWKHPNQCAKIFIATPDGVYSTTTGWGTTAENTETIYLADRILKTLQNTHTSEIEKLKKEIAEKEAELEKLKQKLAELLNLQKNPEKPKEKPQNPHTPPR